MERYMAEKRWSELKDEVMARFRDSIEQDAISQAKKAVKEDRAEVLFFSCTLWGGMLKPVAEAVNVPVLDPVITVLKSAELAIKARVC
jgi:Asp/Glu/hydantoin racemase